MERLIVKGGNRLVGTVKTSGAKNAVLPIIAASILGTSPSRLDEIPALEDVRTICAVLECLGIKVDASEPHTLKIDSREITSCEAPYELVRSMRASFLVMGPLLARKGYARISQPGGCAIGTRPIDLHLKGFEALGVKIEQGHGYIEASAPEGMTGANIYLDFPSVGATENIMMAAAMANGTTVLENPAEEPEIVDLANYLNQMGARVRGAGTNVITIEGVSELHGVQHSVIPDRIEAGTYMIAAAMTGGDVIIENVLPEHQKPLIAKLREAGAEFGAKTGRPRRVGPIDLVATRYGVEMQGATSIALTKLDVLSYMDKIPLCAHYEIDGVQTDDFPFPVLLDSAKPVMEYMPGWQCDISGARRWEDLPEAARSYVEYVEKAIGCPIDYVSVGAERESLILR